MSDKPRQSIARTIAELSEISRVLAENRVKFLISNLAVSDELALNLDADAYKQAAELLPDLFPGGKKAGQYGKTVYFRYKSGP